MPVADLIQRWPSKYVFGGTEVAACACVVYWGNMTGTAGDRTDEALTITVEYEMTAGIALRVRKGLRVGSDFSLVASYLHGQATLVLSDGGWYSEPEVTVPTLPLQRRLSRAVYGACLAGEIDPVNGDVNKNNCYDVGDYFDRANDTNLGSAWDVILQSGNGWDVSSNVARCSGYGFERWDARPSLRDVTVQARVRLSATNNVFGLFTDTDYSSSYYNRIFGVCVWLVQGASSVEVSTKLYWHNPNNGGAADQEIVTLDTQTLTAAPGDVLDLAVARDGNGYTITVSSGGNEVSYSFTSRLFKRPGTILIYGDTTAGSGYVYLDHIFVTTDRRRRLS